jgi:hypothetical protein
MKNANIYSNSTNCCPELFCRWIFMRHGTRLRDEWACTRKRFARSLVALINLIALLMVAGCDSGNDRLGPARVNQLSVRSDSMLQKVCGGWTLDHKKTLALLTGFQSEGNRSELSTVLSRYTGEMAFFRDGRFTCRLWSGDPLDQPEQLEGAFRLFAERPVDQIELATERADGVRLASPLYSNLTIDPLGNIGGKLFPDVILIFRRV